ncbi:unnamed protein product [Linum trigynum]|uniref:Uncharacterized protein n=1 Tax=Linum trigynum TaxID=586398 RepID=A0AAV2FCC8_9ROSI
MTSARSGAHLRQRRWSRRNLEIGLCDGGGVAVSALRASLRISQIRPESSIFCLLAHELMRDKHFDPSKIESDLMKLFELEAYKAWAALESAMEAAITELRRFEEEMDGMAKEKAASVASKRFVPGRRIGK